MSRDGGGHPHPSSDAPFAEGDGDRGRTRSVDDGVLGALVAELAADEAVKTRSRAHWLGRQAAAEGTFAGVLVDLAERARPVVVQLHNGRMHRGVVTVVGADFVIVRASAGKEVAITMAAVASVRTLPGDTVTIGDRFRSSAMTFAEMLSSLEDERVDVMVMGLDARQPVIGQLRAVGRDVLTLRCGGDGGTAYIALASVAEMSAVESG